MTHAYLLEHVSNDDLLARLNELVRGSNRLTAQVLAHLAEVEVRGIHRERACSSLYAYCLYELRMSEDEAQRRIVAARAARRFPMLFEMLETSAIHLTAIVLLAPHLTDENHEELLARARFRTKREVQKLVSEVAPRPDVPSVIEPLGPSRPGGRATWSAFTQSLTGPVRNWVVSGLVEGCARDVAAPEPADESPAPERVGGRADPNGDVGALGVAGRASADESPAPERVALERPDAGPSAQRYKVQFTADESYVELLEQARDLLQHEVFDRDIAVVHRRALEELVAKLRKRRFATSTHAVERAPAGTAESNDEGAPDPGSRHIPAEVRRRVWERDEGRCAFVDERGTRCRERAGLEFHHREPYFRGGRATIENIALFCRAHNELAAEHDLGRDYVEHRIEERRREGR